jgi:hypothetical protein
VASRSAVTSRSQSGAVVACLTYLPNLQARASPTSHLLRSWEPQHILPSAIRLQPHNMEPSSSPLTHSEELHPSPPPSPPPPPPPGDAAGATDSIRRRQDSKPPQTTTASIYSIGHHDDDDADPDDEDDDEDDGYPPLHTTGGDDDLPTDSLLPPPTFKPLFTLISDPQTAETHHPSIYYVFSDDAEREHEGHDVATIAALRALESTTDQQTETTAAEQHEAVTERFVLVDLEPSSADDPLGLRVKTVSSLSPSWAVTWAHLRPAPTLEEDAEETNESLMLMIEGCELAEPSRDHTHHTAHKRAGTIKRDDDERRVADLLQEARKRGGGGGTVLEGMGELWKNLNEGLAVLDKVLAEEHK